MVYKAVKSVVVNLIKGHSYAKVETMFWTINTQTQLKLVEAGKAWEVAKYCKPQDTTVQLAVIEAGQGNVLAEYVKPSSEEVQTALIKAGEAWAVALFCKPSVNMMHKIIDAGFGWAVDVYCKPSDAGIKEKLKSVEHTITDITDTNPKLTIGERHVQKGEREITSKRILKAWAKKNLQ
jgi:hypothetical protein